MKATILAAFPGAGLGEHALAQVRSADPARIWALLAVGSLSDLGLDRAAIDAEFADRVRFQHLAAGCSCCTAGPVLSVTLNRLLRAGPVDQLLVLADARSHLEGLGRALEPALARGMTAAPRPSRVAVMTPAQRVLLEEPSRAGHEAALALKAWAGGRITVASMGPGHPPAG